MFNKADLTVYKNRYNLSSLQDIIKIELYHNPLWNKDYAYMDDICNKIIDNFKELGIFYKDSNLNLYYFYKKEKNIYKLDGKEFLAVLSNITWINKILKEFLYIHEEIKKYCLNHWIYIEIKEYSFYDKKNNILYLSSNNWYVVKIEKNNISLIENWSNWLIFKNNWKSWDFNENIDFWEINKTFTKILKLSSNSNNFIDIILESLNLNNSQLTIEEQRLLLKSYFYWIFFENIFKNKTMLVLLWPKDS